MLRFITRSAVLAAAIGSGASVLAHVVSFTRGHDTAPPWFLAVFFAIFPLGVFVVYISFRVGKVHGLWGREQRTFFDRALPTSWSAARTGVFLYAAVRFAWFALTNGSEEPPDDSRMPLGLLSAFTTAFHLTFAMILYAALRDAQVLPPGNTPLQPTSGAGAGR